MPDGTYQLNRWSRSAARSMVHIRRSLPSNTRCAAPNPSSPCRDDTANPDLRPPLFVQTSSRFSASSLSRLSAASSRSANESASKTTNSATIGWQEEGNEDKTYISIYIHINLNNIILCSYIAIDGIKDVRKTTPRMTWARGAPRTRSAATWIGATLRMDVQSLCFSNWIWCVNGMLFRHTHCLSAKEEMVDERRRSGHFHIQVGCLLSRFLLVLESFLPL